MRKQHNRVSLLALTFAVAALSGAQETNPTVSPNQTKPEQPSQVEMQDGTPVYKIQVVARDVPAVNYFHRTGATKIGFEGTSLLPNVKGDARVEARAGRTSIDANFEGLSPANGFGNEYLTYVLWAITPEGRPVNLGEVLPSGSKDKNQITVTTNLQAFGLIVTAEPYYAVTMPSDLIVAQNVVLADKTQGVVEHVDAHYTLLPRGAYAETAGHQTVLNPITRNERSPLELYEAVNAVQIAEAAGAEDRAADTLVTAKTALKNAQDLDSNKGDRKQIITYAREAVQSAEDARIISIRKLKAEDEAAEKQARATAEQAAQQAQQLAQQQAEQRAKADAAAQKAQEAQAAAEQSAHQAAQQAEQMRERLREQLSAVLQTNETARGLIVNMSDVLFDFNKHTLKPEAREKLAKVSGILLAYPNLKLQVEGYTDNIGSDEYNQMLSEKRAEGVREYLIEQRVPDPNITAQGYGKSSPIADNSTNSGRALNRRVQLVVTGDAIGIQQSERGSQSNTQPATTAQPDQSAQGNSTAASNPEKQNQ